VNDGAIIVSNAAIQAAKDHAEALEDKAAVCNDYLKTAN